MNKLKKFLSFAAIVLVIFILCIGGNQIFRTSYKKLKKDDQTMIRQLSEVYKTYKENGENIWTEDYNFDDIPLVLTPVKKDRGVFHKYSYVIGVPQIEKSIFSKRIEIPEEFGLPPVYRVSALNPKLLITFMPFNFYFKDMDDTHAYFFKYTKESLERTNTIGCFKYFMMHEAFHEYRQIPKWSNVSNDIPKEDDLITVISPKSLDSDHYQLLMVELDILDEVREMEDKEKIIKLMEKWAVTREHRYSKWPYMKNEGKVETMEGTAEYIEFAYSRVVGDEIKGAYPLVDGSSYSYGDIFNEERIKSISEEGMLQSFMNKDLYYFTGVDICTAMEKLEIDWKSRVENGELVPEIIMEFLEIESIRNKDNILEEIKKVYEYKDKSVMAEMIRDNIIP